METKDFNPYDLLDHDQLKFLYDFEEYHTLLSQFIYVDDNCFLIVQWRFTDDFVFFTLTPKSCITHLLPITFYFLSYSSVFRFSYKYRGSHTFDFWVHLYKKSFMLSRYYVLRFLDSLTNKQREAYVIGYRY